MINIAVIGAGYWGAKLIGEYLALSKKRHSTRAILLACILGVELRIRGMVRFKEII